MSPYFAGSLVGFGREKGDRSAMESRERYCASLVLNAVFGGRNLDPISLLSCTCSGKLEQTVNLLDVGFM